MGGTRPDAPRPIRTVDDVHDAIAHYVATMPIDRMLATAQHISTDIDFAPVSEARMSAALARREEAGPAERDMYAGFIFEAFLTALERLPEAPLLPAVDRRGAAALRDRQQAPPGHDLPGG